MDVTLEKLQGDLKVLQERKEHTMNAYHQICGAESIIQQMMAHLVTPEPQAQKEPPKVEDSPSDDQQDTGDNQQADHE
jgi:hypothetical protein